jgi:PKD repeat protein
MNKRILHIAALTALATGACAPNALAFGEPTADIDTSAKPVFNQGYFWAPAGEKVFFNAFHSKAGGFGATIKKIEFDLNGNGIYDYTSTNPLPSASWTFQAPGRYVTIKLRVTNSFDKTDVASLKLRVNPAPTPDLSVPNQPVTAGEQVLLDGTASTDDEAGLSYAFDPEGDGTYTAYQPSPVYLHTYTQAGGYAVRMKVRDRFGLESVATRGLQVNAAPVATPTPSPTPSPTPEADTTAPELSLLTESARLTGKRVALTLGCPVGETRCIGDVTLAKGGRATVDLAGGTTQTIKVSVKKKARKRIKRRGSVRSLITMVATDASANSSTTTGKVKLTR